jgi:hypothetical protein
LAQDPGRMSDKKPMEVVEFRKPKVVRQRGVLLDLFRV